MVKRVSLSGLAVVFCALSAPGIGAVCHEGEWPGIGIDAYHCGEGACSEHRVFRDGATRPIYDFGSEPRLLLVDVNGPAEGLLEADDVLVAVNGYLITSSRGGQELGSLAIGEPAFLAVRRGNRLIVAEVVPELRCEAPTLIAAGTDDATEAARERLAAASAGSTAIIDAGNTVFGPGPLGLTLRCDACSLSIGTDGKVNWKMGDYPRVQAVAAGSSADDAGLQPGDVLTHVGGKDLRSANAAPWLFRGTPPATVALRYRRNDAARETKLVPPVDGGLVELPGPASASAPTSGERGVTATSIATGADGQIQVSGQSMGIKALGVTFEWCVGCWWGYDAERVFAWQVTSPPVISAIDAGGPAAVAGLRVGDVVLAIDGHGYAQLAAGESLLSPAADDPLRLEYERGGKRTTATVRPR